MQKEKWTQKITLITTTVIDSGKIYQWMLTGERFKRNRIKEKKKKPSLKCLPIRYILITKRETKLQENLANTSISKR